MKNSLEYAWAAGFIDGDGNIRWRLDPKRNENRSRQYGCFLIQAGQVSRNVLDRLSKILGGKVYGPYFKRENDYFQFCVVGAEATKSYSNIRPYLSRVKKLQGDKALQEYIKFSKRPRLGNGIQRKNELKK